MTESSVETFKRDYAKLASRPDSKTVSAQLKDWFDDYNWANSHSALGYLPLRLFREKRSFNQTYQRYRSYRLSGSRPLINF
ncbi:MAG: transposase [Polaromonas sp.]|nr:transposase [Polaromonas sp.]